MSNDNLILFPKKSNPKIDMSQSEVKWMLSGSLLVVLCIALGINASLFNEGSSAGEQIAGEAVKTDSRAIASVNPIFRVSWEKKAFEVLDKAKERDLANVGKAPSPFDQFVIGSLEGHYDIRKVDGHIAEIQLAGGDSPQPKSLREREEFLRSNLALFSGQAKSIKKVHVEDNDQVIIERFQMLGDDGQDLGIVQVLLDQDSKLLSMTVQ